MSNSSVILLHPVRNQHAVLLSDLAAEHIRQMIYSQEFPPGSRLPSERKLSERLGVSRPALREALRILEASGVIEVRMSRGRFVAQHPSGYGTTLANSDWLQLHQTEVAELNHVLQLIEPAGVLEVPAHLLPSVAAEARSICLRMEAAVEAGDGDMAAALDCDFHLSLSKRTPNRLLRDLIARLIEASSESAHIVYSIPTAARKSLDQHWTIVQALEEGSRDAASRHLVEHAAVAYRFAAEHMVQDRG